MPVIGPAWAWSSAMSPRSRSGTAPSPGTRVDLICHSAALCLARCDRPALLSDYSHRRSSRTLATGRAGSASGLRNSGSTAPGRIRTRRTSADLASSSCSGRSFRLGRRHLRRRPLRVARRGPAGLRPLIGDSHPAMPTDPFPVLLPFTDAAPPSSRSTRCDSPTNPTPSTGAVQWGHRVQASGIEIDETRYYSNDHPPLHRRRT